MKTIKNNLEAVKEHLTDLNKSELVDIWNTYARENAEDDEIYNNDDDFFNTFFEGKPGDAVRAAYYGEYKYNDEFVYFNGYANLESFNNPTEYIDIDLLAENILENPSEYDIELEDEEEEPETSEDETTDNSKDNSVN